MQVAHQNDHITHAVIGGAATIDFGISSSAEFFNILSSTLYKDQILAVVREVLCNAWDAHIEAGIMDRPVEITMTHDKFKIRDFGTGIHRDDMGKIYGTYGNSTKKNDGQQTGGFGLGCKAPFAYTDHFEVVSHHDGIRTIYNLSKSSAAASGKPGIVPIASFPTQETGLQVSIDIHNKADLQRFLNLIHRIVRNGDMNMTLNGNKLDTIGFNSAESNYLLTIDQHNQIMDTQHRIMVRYGNVIYPVDHAGAINQGYREVAGHLDKLMMNRSYRRYLVVFQAPPHSISVTPSRESLSMQEHTINTLNSLFDGFMKEINGGFIPTCLTYAEGVIKTAVREANKKDLLSWEAKLPLVVDNHAPDKISDLVTMAKHFVESNYPTGLAFRKKDITWRLEGMAASGQLDRGLVRSYLNELNNVTTTRNLTDQDYPQKERTQWLQRRIIAPMIKKMCRAGIDYKRLYVLDEKDTMVPHRYNYKGEPTVIATSSKPLHLFNTLPYFRNIVVISTSVRDIHERARHHDVFKELGDYHGYLFYKASMKKKERDAELAFFQGLGVNLVDLTFRQEGEATPTRLASAPRKPAKKGLPSLKAIKDAGVVDIRTVAKDTVARMVNPEFSICVSLRRENCAETLGRWDAKCSSHIVDLFGDKGVIINNQAMHDRAIKNGALQLDDYVEKKVVEAMLNSPRILEYWAFDHNRVCEHLGVYNEAKVMLKAVYNSELLRDQFKLVNNLTDDEKKIIDLWRGLSHIHRYGFTDEMKKVQKLLNGVQLDPANAELVKKFSTYNPLLAIFNNKALTEMLNNAQANSPQIIKMTKILAIAFDN